MWCSLTSISFAIFAIFVLSVGVMCDDEPSKSSSESKKTRCATQPDASKKIDKVIKECESDLKIKLIKDTFLVLQEEKIHPHHPDDEDQDDHHSHHHSYHHEKETEEDHKQVNLHLIHEPKPTDDHNHQHHKHHYDHHYYDRHRDQYHDNEYSDKYYESQHEYQSASPSYDQHYDLKTKSWPYPDQPSPAYGHQELNKKYWPYRAKRSPRKRYDLDDEDEAWKYNYELDENVHSATILPEDRWIAGCLIHCVLEKNNATDKHGWPTLDGLVNFYTEGVHEHDYFVATLRFVDHCLKGASHRHGVHRHMMPEKGQHCDLSFDVFDCVTDKITEYCAHKH